MTFKRLPQNVLPINYNLIINPDINGMKNVQDFAYEIKNFAILFF